MEALDSKTKQQNQSQAQRLELMFQNTLKKFEEDLSKDIIKWRRTNASIQQRQEEISHQIGMICEMNQCVTDEFTKMQQETR